MLEMALAFLGISAWLPSLGMIELAAVLRTLSVIYFVTFLVAAVLAAVMHGQIERRVLHHG